MKKYLLLLCLCLLNACGTIVTSRTQDIQISSNVPAKDLKVFVNGKKVENFDGKITLNKNIKDNFITVKSDKYLDANRSFDRTVHPLIFAGDIFLVLFPITLPIDFITGGIYEITPSEIRINLIEKDN